MLFTGNALGLGAHEVHVRRYAWPCSLLVVLGLRAVASRSQAVKEASQREKSQHPGPPAEKKVLRDVFKQGDAWFRSGDLLYKDAKGLWHFVDRIGDTFRWKGENVSTMEVSQVLSSLPGVEEANVYGVQVPGEADGRACMAALRGQDLQSREKLDALQSLCEKELPSYARPRFLRFLSDMDVTGTFKHQKVQLREQGFDPSKVPDPVYILHPTLKRYEALDATILTQLQQGRSKL
eukprot:symbB.v1.2.009625.t1/scaffold615.1/size180423/3